MEHMNGGCLCGAVRYQVNAEPLAMGFCHCRSCQRSTGEPRPTASLRAAGEAIQNYYLDCFACGSQ